MKLVLVEVVCPEVGRKHVRYCSDYKRGLACLDCPDKDKIPKGCDLRCGWPDYIQAGICPYQGDCPCAREPGEERSRVIERFRERQ